jgi:hypothetical protein
VRRDSATSSRRARTECAKATPALPEYVKEFVDAFHAEVNRQRRDAEIAAGIKRKELGEVQRRLDGLVDATADGLRSMGWQTRLDRLEFANLTTILANDPGTSSAIIIPEGPAIGRPRYTILEWFSAFLFPSVQLPEDLAALAEALDILDSDQRANFLATFDETELRLFFGRPWLSLRGRPTQDYEAFCELLRRVLAAGRKWGSALWCQTVARQLAIVLASNLDRRDEATGALDAAGAEWGDHVSLRDQRATIAFAHGD